MRRIALSVLVCGMAGVMLAPLPVVLRPNSYTRAKVGDWAEYKTTNLTPSRNPFVKSLVRDPQFNFKVTVTDKDGKSLSVQKADIVQPLRKGYFLSGTYISGWDVSLDSPVSWADEQFGESNLHPFGYREDVQRKLLTQGTETLRIQGRAFACTWTKWAAKTAWAKRDFVVTVWRCAEAPLDGTVKILIEKEREQTEILLVAFGRGK